MPLLSYAWKTGHGQALVDLVNVETDLLTYTNGKLRPPKSLPVNLYPARTTLLGGKERGDGMVKHEWLFGALPVAALNYIEDTYCTGGVSTAITILTRRHNQEVHARYNAYICLPVPGQDYQFDSDYILNLRLRFTDLVAL